MTDPARFPDRPVRSVRYRKHGFTGCGPFVDVTLDFAPAEEGVVFEVAPGVLADWEWPEDLPVFFAACERGVREELSEAAPGTRAAVRVVLTGARAHAVDSGEYAFLLGGRYATREALARAAAGEPEPSGAGGGQSSSPR
ncbi:hypothetical protein [Kitasatospora sp. DSM 101779]|uniref:hypothetical protein n=1 Tax=Kitasatospora sp. DSM 101779 TaxID=2853165 RepID=UPI0021D98961|nr:hypothetical protein [Kitasatospora sp. DSM 101779]MCU7820674.1 hypothetical protein [Kitasatospora sp. DSM 101779]